MIGRTDCSLLRICNHDSTFVKGYLSHGCAGSRAGHKSVLFVAPMSPDGTRLLGGSRIVYDGHQTQPTIEGTKFYKYKGSYYIFSPAGGVPTGWQVVLRGPTPYGPYEERVVMAQGDSPVNGPHQGAWVDTPSGEHWFMHFQDKDAYGRVVHLQPMVWTSEGWPVIGEDKDGDGVGTPVMKYRKPLLKCSGVFQPAESDTFDSLELGLQWQWHGIPSPYWYYIDSSSRETIPVLRLLWPFAFSNGLLEYGAFRRITKRLDFDSVYIRYSLVLIVDCQFFVGVDIPVCTNLAGNIT